MPRRPVNPREIENKSMVFGYVVEPQEIVELPVFSKSCSDLNDDRRSDMFGGQTDASIVLEE